MLGMAKYQYRTARVFRLRYGAVPAREGLGMQMAALGKTRTVRMKQKEQTTTESEKEIGDRHAPRHILSDTYCPPTHEQGCPACVCGVRVRVRVYVVHFLCGSVCVVHPACLVLYGGVDLGSGG